MIRERNYTIDILRLLMALLIVALHCNVLAEYSAIASYIPSQILSRLGVPFFATVAGYYFFLNEKTEKYSLTLRKYVETYTIWSILYFIYELVLENKIGGGIVWHMVKIYLFTGFYHLWYMLAIIYTILLLWCLKKVNNITKYVYRLSFVFLLIGIAMFGYGKLFFKNSIVQRTIGLINQNDNMQSQWLFLVVPFFMLGYGIKKWEKSALLSQLYERCEIWVVIIGAVYIIEVIVLQFFDWMNNTTLCLTTYPLILMLMLYSIKHPHIGSKKVANYCSKIAAFIYFSHICFILIFQKIGFSETPTYLLTILISGALGLCIVKKNTYILNKLL